MKHYSKLQYGKFIVVVNKRKNRKIIASGQGGLPPLPPRRGGRGGKEGEGWGGRGAPKGPPFANTRRGGL